MTKIDIISGFLGAGKTTLIKKLIDVIKAIQKASENVEIALNSATTVVDVTKAKMYIKNFGEFFLNQIEACGTVVLSRTQNVDEDKLLVAVDMIKEHNAEARIITTPWDDITGEIILDAMEHSSSIEDIMKNFKYDPEVDDEDEHEHHHHHHHHDHDDEEDEHEHHHHHDRR